MGSHISQLSDKTARGILGATLQDDVCHENILVAAGELVARRLGHYTYATQWYTGTTCWRDDANGGPPVLVDSFQRLTMVE